VVDTHKEPEADKAAHWRLEIIEGRRAQVEAFTWSIPGLAIAGQAFLLTIALSSDVTSVARLLAALAGFTAAVAATHLYGKQIYLFDLYEAVMEKERKELRLPGVQLDALLKGHFPENTLYMKRGWANKRSWRHRVIVSQRSAVVWFLALIGFVLLDLFILIYAIAAVAGADPHWLD
jgi:hypothetical protein